MKALMLTLAILPAPLWAQQYPSVEYYIGLYRIIGVDDVGPVDRMLRIDAKGDQPVLSLCGATGTMILPSATGDEHYVGMVIDGLQLICEPFNTYDNYPLLACFGDGDSKARLTVWPADVAGAPLTCAE